VPFAAETWLQVPLLLHESIVHGFPSLQEATVQVGAVAHEPL
jgi:hypothetical protein